MKATFFRIISLAGLTLALAFALNACGSDSGCTNCSSVDSDNFGGGVACNMSNISKFDCMEIVAFSSDKKEDMEGLCHSLGGTVAEKCSTENVCSTALGEIEEGMLYKEFRYESSPYCAKQNSIAFNYAGYCNEHSGIFSDAELSAMEAAYRADAAKAGVAIDVKNKCSKENVECSKEEYDDGWYDKRFYYKGSPYCAKQNVFAYNFIDYGYCLEISGIFSDNYKKELGSEY
ncbi:MAG: hypothetical protein LBH25_06640, partial [Fibromonadaceae bacterium]|nr:hypothetical protein [Fibromonadaceae bacterium]